MKNLIKPSIGIWGLGRVGKAAVRYFAPQAEHIFVFDNRPLTSDEVDFLAQHNAHQAASLDELFAACSKILPSPGIDIEPYLAAHSSLFLNELDLFYDAWQKPIIAITGSVGKTTTTTLITQLMAQSGIRVCAAGNIGFPVFDVLSRRDSLDMVVLEVSSFQLEHCVRFAPDLALWTTFFPNHLDRHTTVENYFDAKYALIKNQTSHQKALVPYELLDRIAHRNPRSMFFSFGEAPASLPSVRPERTSERSPQDAGEDAVEGSGKLFLPCILRLRPRLTLGRPLRTNGIRKIKFYINYKSSYACRYAIQNNKIVRAAGNKSNIIIDLATVPDCTFPLNWLIAYSALDILKISAHALATPLNLEHRLEKVAIINGVTFYNDSKSTVPISTLAALQTITAPRIMLFLGGLSKGIDRAPFIASLAAQPITIFCFGKEAESLHAMCTASHISSHSYGTLDDAFAHCIKQLNTGDCVLFSPAGSSYDLFANYEERGNAFKNHVFRYQKQTQSSD